MNKTCEWIIPAAGRRFVQCSQSATHRCPLSDRYYCRDHAADYESVFGFETLNELPIEEDPQ